MQRCCTHVRSEGCDAPPPHCPLLPTVAPVRSFHHTSKVLRLETHTRARGRSNDRTPLERDNKKHDGVN
eukprot:12403423-Alexandrium_andersonii.AAC.1